jgi:hypothetical protein
MSWHAFEHGASQSSFTRTHFARQQYKATFAIKPILEMSDGLTMLITGVQKPRIGNNRERLAL